MEPKTRALFLMLVCTQALHSLEEYAGRLWEVFPPANWLCRLVDPADLHTGFLIINIGLFVAGILVWYFPVRRQSAYAWPLVGFWILIELVNGVGHPVWSVMRRGYTPGVATAPLLLALAICLLVSMRPRRRMAESR